jgi:hypothetical protein
MALRTRAKPPASIEEILAATPKPAALIEIELERISHIAHMRKVKS